MELGINLNNYQITNGIWIYKRLAGSVYEVLFNGYIRPRNNIYI